MSYQFTTRQNGKPTPGYGFAGPGANALATANAVKAKMAALSSSFRPTSSTISHMTSRLTVVASIQKVLITLVEAMVLVFLVMLLFLQNISLHAHSDDRRADRAARHMRHAADAGPVDQRADAVRHGAGDRHPRGRRNRRGRERRAHHVGGRISPKEATRKAMSQITGAIIGITLVLVSVFIPMAFFPGSVGIIYKQFSITMVAAIGFSALLALSLTPALCATLLKPVKAGEHHAKPACSAGSIDEWAGPDRLRRVRRMGDLAGGPLHAGLRWCWWSVGLAFLRLPGGFLPVDDQGFITTDVQAPPEASFPRTLEAVKSVEDYLAKRPGVDRITFLTGFSFLGQGRTRRRHSSRSRTGPNAELPILQNGSSPTSTATSQHSVTARSRRFSRRQSTIWAIQAASASAFKIADSAATPN